METLSTLFKNLLALMVLAGIGFACTDQCNETYTYIEYTPQYMDVEAVRTSFDVLPPQEIERSGKIYLYGQTLFVTEPDSGIHVVDNSDPRTPVKKKFIQLSGVHDITVKGTTMYADSYMDLVVLDISDLNNITMLQRLENVFANQYYFYEETATSFITHYEETDRVQMNELDCDRASIIYDEWVLFVDAFNDGAIAEMSGSVSGVSGSMARMNIVGDYLYGIDDWQLNVFDLTNPQTPSEINQVDVGWGIETLFPYQNNLFIGAADGMYIFENSNPLEPTFLSKFNHARACDPVVVQDDIAFVTLRDGTECDGFANQLDVVDVSNLSSPSLLYSFEMDNPHGLGVDGDALFICEGDYGLKLFDKSDLSQIDSHLQNWIKDVHAYDVIPLGGLLILIGEDGLYQFDYSDPENIDLLSVILTK